MFQKLTKKQQETFLQEQLKAKEILEKFTTAQSRRAPWETHWKEAYDYTIPQRSVFFGGFRAGSRRVDNLFDATAADAAEQLAASLLSQLTPPWSQWVGLKPGPALNDQEIENIAPVLEKATQTIREQFDRSNFAVEMHQCYLDLVVGGTACLLFEETKPGAYSAFKFTAIPLSEVYLAEGEQGRLDVTFRSSEVLYNELSDRFPKIKELHGFERQAMRDENKTYQLIESVIPDGHRYEYTAILMDDNFDPILLKEKHLNQSPFINFRWLKSPGEIYGRSPVMKALPDIKTANKVVELILKNASIAVTGIWQADDDGVLNPANIKLTPGSIIPKAVGSAGLKPLQMPGNFDVSQLVLEDLRRRINHALLADRLTQINDRRMTATEVLERSAEMAQILGATYGRLQSEMLMPISRHAYQILKRRGAIPDLMLDGRTLALDDRSPLARAQAQRDVQSTLSWMNTALSYGPEGAAAIDTAAAVRWLGKNLGVPMELIKAPVQQQGNAVIQQQPLDALALDTALTEQMNNPISPLNS